MERSYVGDTMSDPNRYLEQDEINAIIGATKRQSYRMLFFFLAGTGRRVSEVVRCLKPGDINWTEGYINFTILKRRKNKEFKMLLPVLDKFLLPLKRYIKDNHIRDDQFIFPMSRQRAGVIFKQAAYKVGIYHKGLGERNKPHLHLLRHSFGMRGAANASSPAAIRTLQESMGHSSIDTTMFYLNFSQKDKKKLLEEMFK